VYKAVSKAVNPLPGAAKTTFIEKCEADAKGGAPGGSGCAEKTVSTEDRTKLTILKVEDYSTLDRACHEMPEAITVLLVPVGLIGTPGLLFGASNPNASLGANGAEPDQGNRLNGLWSALIRNL
jgi:hypothetical protein